MNDHEERIRRWAHKLWEEEGRPEGRDKDHWDKATELVAIEDNQKSTTIPVRQENIGPEGEPVEEAKTLDNLGEFPTLTDQGEQKNPDR